MGIATGVRTYAVGRRLQIPMSIGRGAGAAIATSMACQPLVVAAHHGVWAAATLGGVRCVPGRTSLAVATPSSKMFDAVRSDVALVAGAFDTAAILQRRQDGRGALLALGFRHGSTEPIAFIKAASAEVGDGLEREARCLSALAAVSGHGLVHIPDLIGSGVSNGVRWIAVSPLPARPHRPAYRAPVDEIVSLLQHALDGALERRDAPGHWRAMHGDFAPWNLRKLFGGPLALFDFEDAGFAPPAADRTYWQATSAVLRRDHGNIELDHESCEYWTDVVTKRLDAGVDPTADRRLLAVLEQARY